MKAAENEAKVERRLARAQARRRAFLKCVQDEELKKAVRKIDKELVRAPHLPHAAGLPNDWRACNQTTLACLLCYPRLSQSSPDQLTNLPSHLTAGWLQAAP